MTVPSEPSRRESPPVAEGWREPLNRAVQHLFRGRADLARPIVEACARALPEDLAELIRRDLAVVGFQWPGQRAPVTLARRAPPRPEDVDVVAFHVDLPRAPSGIHRAVDYMAILGNSFESARMRAPAARRLLITDERTRVADSLAVHQVLRYPIDLAFPMFERMRAQQLYLRERDPARASVLMDSDVLVNAEPSAVFAEDFDVGLTWRPEFPDKPFNGGMIFAAPGTGARAFFARALECYRAIAGDPRVAAEFDRDLRTWWGDQFALAALVGHRAFAERKGEALSVDGLRVRFLPCAEYNFTVDEAAFDPAALRGKRFLHFKGNRKEGEALYIELMRSGTI